MNESPPSFNPFPGLRAFYTHEKHLFFGREHQIAEMLQRLRQTRFLAAVGPSGSGKSSLVRAGLIPELYGGTMAKAGSAWEVIVMRPGGDPLGNLAADIAMAGLYDTEAEDLPLQLQATLNRSAFGLVEAVRQSALPKGTNLLLVVDQFEEVFRFCQRNVSQRDWADSFVQLLLEASRQEAWPIYVVLTMRSDFLGDCAQFRGLAEAVNAGSYLIPRLNREQWHAAIEGPVRVGGGQITPRLVQRLLNDVGDDPDQLPILQHALMRTWDYWAAHDATNGPIDLAHYEAIGGMAEALSRHADEAYEGLPDDRDRRMAEKLFKALAETASDNRGIRRPARVAELQALTEASEEELTPVLESFRRAGRTFLMPPPGTPLQPDTVIDISHESLMRVWRRMKAWVDEEAQSTRIYRRLAQTALLWKDEKAGLYRDPDLQIALRWRERNRPNKAWAEHAGGGFDLALEFLDQSRRAQEAEHEAQEGARRRELEQAMALAEVERKRAAERTRAARRLMVLALFLALLAAATVAAAWLAVRAKRLAFSRELIARAVGQLDVDPESSVLLASEAARESAQVLPAPEADDVLRQALLESRLRHKLEGHSNIVRQAVFSADGQFILTAGDDKTARVWDAQSGKLVTVLTNHTAAVNSAEFSPDGRIIVTAGLDARAIVWDASTGKPMRDIGHPGDVKHAAFSPDGLSVATACDDGIARIWGIRSGPSVELRGHKGMIFRVAFNRDGSRLVTASEDGTARIWNLRAGGDPVVLRHDSNSVVSAAFSPDDRFVATAGTDGTARVWESNGTTIAVIHHGKDVEVTSVAFSPDTQTVAVATSSKDGTARVWKMADDATLVLAGHSGPVLGAAFSPDGRYVVTASGDKTARVWSAEKNGGLLAVLRGHEEQVDGAAFSATGQFIVSAGHGGEVRLWEAPAWRNVQLPTQDAAKASFSPDGSLVATLDKKRTARVWETGTGRLRLDLSREGYVGRVVFGHKDYLALTSSNHGPMRIWNLRTTNAEASLPMTNFVNHACFSPDDQWVVAAKNDGKAEVWDWRAKVIIATFDGPPDRSIISAAFSPDGRDVALVNEDKSGASRAWIWEPMTAKVRAQFAHRLQRAAVVAFSPTGDRILLGCGGGEAVLWEWRHDKVQELHGHGGPVNDARFSADGRFAVTAGGDKAVRLWSADTGLGLAVWRGHTTAARSVAFSADGGTVHSVAGNGRVISFSSEACGPRGRLPALTEQRLHLPEEERAKALQHLLPK